MEDNQFSGVVRLSKVDDYIAPSQNCIKPLIDKLKTKVNSAAATSNSEPVQLKNHSVNLKIADDLNTPVQTERVQITLNDCLACSGCVTTAESILIQQQSHLSLIKALQRTNSIVVVSVSPQSIASIAVRLQCSFECSARLITRFLVKNGTKLVLPIAFSRAFSLLAAEREFVSKYKEYKQHGGNRAGLLPVFASACPGWVCFVEKLHGDLALPHMSAARSPQAVAGRLVKTYLANKNDWSVSDVYHAAIMPCFDKKLEASRQQLYLEGVEEEAVPETDCVISTGELYEWMKEENWTDTKAHEQDTNNALQYIINKDLEELILYSSSYGPSADTEPKVLLRFARAYGFRNIQNIMLKMKRDKFIYDYVEVMACPSGCANGGGQLKADSNAEHKKLLAQVLDVMHKNSTDMSIIDTHLATVSQEWSGEEHVNLHTTYAPVTDDLGSMINW